MGDVRLRQAPWASLFFLPHFMGCAGVCFFSFSISSKKGLGVMGVGWIAPALLRVKERDPSVGKTWAVY